MSPFPDIMIILLLLHTIMYIDNPEYLDNSKANKAEKQLR